MGVGGVGGGAVAGRVKKMPEANDFQGQRPLRRGKDREEAEGPYFTCSTEGLCVSPPSRPELPKGCGWRKGVD